MRRQPSRHREDDPLRQGAAEHERTPPPRVWQELGQQEDAEGKRQRPGAGRGAGTDLGALPLQDAFSLLAYSDPWSSPVGYQLDAIQREPVCSTLNSAILGRLALAAAPYAKGNKRELQTDETGNAVKIRHALVSITNKAKEGGFCPARAGTRRPGRGH